MKIQIMQPLNIRIQTDSGDSYDMRTYEAFMETDNADPYHLVFDVKLVDPLGPMINLRHSKP